MRTTTPQGKVLPLTRIPNPFAEAQAEHLRRLKNAPKPKDLAAMIREHIPNATNDLSAHVVFDCFRIRDTQQALEQAAARLEKPYRPSKPTRTGKPAKQFAGTREALTLYGTPRNAVNVITKHVQTLGDEMDDNARKRTGNLVAELRRMAEQDERQEILDNLPDVIRSMKSHRDSHNLRAANNKWTKKARQHAADEAARLNSEMLKMIDNEATAAALDIPWTMIHAKFPFEV